MNDLIKRSDAIKALYKYSFVSKDVIEREIKAVPTADRPQGEWSVDSIDEIELSYGGTAYEPIYKCSCCGRLTESYVRFDKPIMPEDANFPNYCGWCGADMRGESDDR